MTINVTNLTKTAGRHDRLHDLNLTIQPGMIYGLLGRNGAGKSTLLNIMANRVLPSQGKVTIDGQALAQSDRTLQHLYLMSEDNLYPSRERVSDLFKLTTALYGSFDDKLAERLAKAFDLDVNARFGGLSTGYRTIFKDIVALCVPADYILLDEPVLGLDASHRDLFYQSLIETYAQHPRTFVIATHLIEEISGLLNQVIVMDQGRILVAEAAEDLLARSYQLSGPKETMAAFLPTVTTLRTHQFGKQTQAVVTTAGTLDLPAGVTKEALDLQQLFVALTEDHHEV
ncbi:ATP-binding cassette domain-containing protein [Furfurilactobacillus curtus]|uniref:ABC transporter ATP-binding protein n=1 Tax=Furfurilactobacillus curtus TaxID=1746200 RepID=A0ABQ5JRY0_9LACO